jgi:hypothetical protein
MRPPEVLKQIEAMKRPADVEESKGSLEMLKTNIFIL